MIWPRIFNLTFFDKIFKGDNHSLFIRDVQPDDAGNYSVRAGQVTSEAKLTVEARKFTPKFLKNKFLNFAFTLSIICYEIFEQKVSKILLRISQIKLDTSFISSLGLIPEVLSP